MTWYRFGEWIIKRRFMVLLVLGAMTVFFGYFAAQTQLVTSFGDLLPQSHPFVKIHNKYSGTFGGANNINIMIQVKEGSIFTVETLNKIWKMTEGLDKVSGVLTMLSTTAPCAISRLPPAAPCGRSR